MFTVSIHHVYNCIHFAIQCVIFLFLCVWDRALHWQSIQICERLGYIVEELKSYDIVGLQEVQSLTYNVCVCFKYGVFDYHFSLEIVF